LFAYPSRLNSHPNKAYNAERRYEVNKVLHRRNV